MKLSELLEGWNDIYTGPRTGYGNPQGWQNFGEHDIQDLVERVQKSKEYRDLTAIVPMVSTKTMLSHGLFSFEITKDLLYYDINIQGNVRYKSRDNVRYKFSTGLLKVGKYNLDTEPYERYLYNLKEVFDKIQKRENRSSSPRSAALNGAKDDTVITSISQIESIDTINNFIRLWNMELSDLEGCPRINELSVQNNKVQLSLKGCPQKLKELQLIDTKVVDWEYLPKIITEKIFFTNTGIKSLEGWGRKVILKCSKMNFENELIKSHILGLLKVEGLEKVRGGWSHPDKEWLKAVEIINNHLQGDRDILDCQEELIAAGLKDYAKL